MIQCVYMVSAGLQDVFSGPSSGVGVWYCRHAGQCPACVWDFVLWASVVAWHSRAYIANMVPQWCDVGNCEGMAKVTGGSQPAYDADTSSVARIN